VFVDDICQNVSSGARQKENEMNLGRNPSRMILAAAGVVIGAIAGDAGKGAAIGAAAGGLGGGMRSRRTQQEAEAQSQAAVDEYNRKLEIWDRNYVACVGSRDYTVN
jgi:uncharacterized protein YcfJ